jgi:hypothetical protein
MTTAVPIEDAQTSPIKQVDAIPDAPEGLELSDVA